MHIIIYKNFREFVAGIFSRKDSLNEYVYFIPSEASRNIRQLEVNVDYPFYIIENGKGFSYLSESEVLELIDNYIADMNNHDDDWCYANLYRVDADFAPKTPGKDYMGSLNHLHLDNSTLNNIIRNGFNTLW